MRPHKILAALLLPVLLAVLSPANAEQLLMARSSQSFPEAMVTLQDSIHKHGYTLSRVQRVDVGLTTFGYKTDKYRVVFFGKPEEIRDLISRHPQLAPFLPLKLTIFAEEDETVVVAFDPMMLREMVSETEVEYQLTRWKNDILSILADLRNAR